MKSWKAKAIMEDPDRLWQTRRLSGLKEINKEPNRWEFIQWKYKMTGEITTGFYFKRDDGLEKVIKPRYKVGEVVYIKEAWLDNVIGCPNGLSYKLDHLDPKGDGPANPMKWKSPMFMPEKFARTFRQITGVRSGRLQEITFADIYAEGCPLEVATIFTDPAEGYEIKANAYEWYHDVWNSINPKYPWESNPWVLAYTTKRWEV